MDCLARASYLPHLHFVHRQGHQDLCSTQLACDQNDDCELIEHIHTPDLGYGTNRHHTVIKIIADRGHVHLARRIKAAAVPSDLASFASLYLQIHFLLIVIFKPELHLHLDLKIG